MKVKVGLLGMHLNMQLMAYLVPSIGWVSLVPTFLATNTGPHNEKTTNLKMHPLSKNGEVVHCHGCAFWWVYKYVFKLDNEFLSIYKYPL